MLTPTYINTYPELFIRILTYLNLSDIFACQQTHSAFYALIKSPTLLQYHIATLVAGVDDNPWLTFSVRERLERLSSRDAGWAHHEFDFSRVVSVPRLHDDFDGYDFTAGTFFVNMYERGSINYCVLPSKASDEPQWAKVEAHASLIEVGMAIYEHDLMAMAIREPKDERYIIVVEFVELSSGDFHPQAPVFLAVRDGVSMVPPVCFHQYCWRHFRLAHYVLRPPFGTRPFLRLGMENRGTQDTCNCRK